MNLYTALLEPTVDPSVLESIWVKASSSWLCNSSLSLCKSDIVWLNKDTAESKSAWLALVVKFKSEIILLCSLVMLCTALT